MNIGLRGLCWEAPEPGSLPEAKFVMLLSSIFQDTFVRREATPHGTPHWLGPSLLPPESCHDREAESARNHR